MAGTYSNQEQAEIINGAKRCMSALRAMEQIAEASGPEFEQCWLAEDAAIKVLLSASEANTPFMRGFLSVIGEYVHMCNGSGTPELSGLWTPNAMMSEQELTAYRAEMVAESIA